MRWEERGLVIDLKHHIATVDNQLWGLTFDFLLFHFDMRVPLVDEIRKKKKKKNKWLATKIKYLINKLSNELVFYILCYSWTTSFEDLLASGEPFPEPVSLVVCSPSPCSICATLENCLVAEWMLLFAGCCGPFSWHLDRRMQLDCRRH